MKVVVRIDKSEQKRFAQFLIQEIAEQIERKLRSKTVEIRQKIQHAIREEWEKDPTVLSLKEKTFGSLKGDLGLTDAISNNLDQILEAVLKSMNLDFPAVKLFGNKARVVYHWQFLPVNYFDLLGLDIAEYISVSEYKGTSTRIPWLEWLLMGTSGVQGYFVQTWEDGDPGKSRSNFAIMWRNKGRTWRMPSQHAGHANSNFLTKIIQRSSHFVLDILDEL